MTRSRGEVIHRGSRQYPSPMPAVGTTQVIVINGGSSAGKSEISRCLQTVLEHPWLRLGVDDLVDRLPPSLLDSGAGVAFGQQGEVTIGEGFRGIETAWFAGVAAMARAGARIIFEDVFLGGAASQQRMRTQWQGLTILWVGVHCDATTAAAREVARGDRSVGMAALQAEVVHNGVLYDLEVDTTHAESLDCARAIASRVVRG